MAVVISGAAIIVWLLGPTSMPFVRPTLSQGGFLPSAYLLTAVPPAASVLCFRDTVFPISILSTPRSRLTERVILVTASVLVAAIVTGGLWIRLWGYARVDVLICYSLVFLGMTLILASIVGANVGATVGMLAMLVLFAISPVARMNEWLFASRSTWLIVLSIGIGVGGILLGLFGGGVDCRRLTRGSLIGVNDS